VAVVMLALNGVGLGHLIRSTIVSNALASVGERPVIFSEGKYHPAGLAQFPIRIIPSLWSASDDVRKRVSSELWSMAGISLPAVVVEDTHPNPIQLRPKVRRILLVRPTSFEYLVRLNEDQGEVYSAFLLCDSPDSPTWPYDEFQTQQLAGWKKWHLIGPVYRTATEDDIREARIRNRVSEDEELCVFTMGGGGVHGHDTKRQDIIRFLRLALEVADVVQPAGSRVRLLFVKGPYFPPRIPIPPRFEVVQDEEHMPALLKIAKGAVIRAGFNTTWECIAAGTPFIPLIGTTYAEPVQERMNKLTALGLIAPSPKRFWLDDEWRAQYRQITQSIIARHSGTPSPLELDRLILGRRGVPSMPRPKARAIRRSSTTERIPLVIRIDDVVSMEPALGWSLNLLASRGLHASLEVVPYLMEFDEALLHRFDPARTLFQVSQHGYAHVPRMGENGRRCEFLPESTVPTEQELEVIARGKRQLEAAFPQRFAGGFSPPFDAMPPWLPGTWHTLGGHFVSRLFKNTAPLSPLPVTRAGEDVWDWTTDSAFSRHQVISKLAMQFAIEGHAGIVLHPRCLRRRSDKLGLLSLLNYLEGRTVTVPLRDLALGKVEIAKPSARGAMLAASFGRKRSDPTLSGIEID
jgi:hypothetical protein